MIVGLLFIFGSNCVLKLTSEQSNEEQIDHSLILTVNFNSMGQCQNEATEFSDRFEVHIVRMELSKLWLP